VALSENVVTYESLILEDSVPESIIIVGAGAIGIEFAYLLSSYGVDVVVVEYLERALPNEDINVSTETQRQFATMGVKIVTPARLESVVDAGNAVNLTYTDKSGTLNQIAAMKVLMSVGFAPNVDGFGLDTTGVLLSAQGAIEIDEFMQTSTEGIYAIGDVTAKLQLAHVAEAQGVVTAEHASTGRAEPIRDYRMMPRATFCQPQVASFGFTEQQARDAGHDVVVSTFPFVANAKSHALGDSSGFVKLIASAEYGQLLGGHLIGHDVSELLPELTLAQAFELTSRELVHNVHTHPTMSEALQEAFHGLEGHMINF
jgi:dihydrolipoamide dehydrogenase